MAIANFMRRKASPRVNFDELSSNDEEENTAVSDRTALLPSTINDEEGMSLMLERKEKRSTFVCS